MAKGECEEMSQTETKLENELKELLIKELKLVGVKSETIADDAPLFGEGLGLDSLDAVELVVILNKHYKVDLKDMEVAKLAFRSITTLADYIRENRK
jgi:acyl carrier protein